METSHEPIPGIGITSPVTPFTCRRRQRRKVVTTQGPRQGASLAISPQHGLKQPAFGVPDLIEYLELQPEMFAEARINLQAARTIGDDRHGTAWPVDRHLGDPTRFFGVRYSTPGSRRRHGRRI